MNILITGNLYSVATELAKKFVVDKNKIVLVCEDIDKLDVNISNVTKHSIDPADPLFLDTISAFNFDVVIYIATREEQLKTNKGSIGQQLDGLRNTLELSRMGNVKRFFYLSSTEIYGVFDKELPEERLPEPASINGYTLFAGEQYCRLYHQEFELKVTVLRLPYVYGPGETTGFLYSLVEDCKYQNKILLPGGADRICSFLHVNDIADFLIRALDEEYSHKALVVNLSSSKPVTNLRIVELLKKNFPTADIDFDKNNMVYTRSVSVVAAKKIYNWIDIQDINSDLDEYIVDSHGALSQKRSGFRELVNKPSLYGNLLKWLELILGAGLTQYLSQLTGVLVQFKYVDFRLLFVVIMGSVYGIQFGFYAALLVSISILYVWLQTGFDWALLIYNVGNWFPFSLYFATGLITGYVSDKNNNRILNEQKQTGLIHEKYSFLYGVYNDIRKLKDEFREQLIGYKDSFGKIFTVTRELDQLDEHAIYFRALGILGDLMHNDCIAIYTLEENNKYARLEVNSTSLNDILTKSIKLSNYPELLPSIERGEIFQNIKLLPNYPAYVSPVLNYSYPFNVPVAIIVIWSVKFEQYSMYYYNLFKVICGLIQASLVRAALFLDANYDATYLPFTRILNRTAFMDVLRIRSEMKENKISEYGLIVVNADGEGAKEIYSRISQGIRPADVIGFLGDGRYCILLPQSSELTTKYVINRLIKLGCNCQLVESNNLMFK